MNEKFSLEQAKSLALRYLGYRARSEMELYKYLDRKGISEEIVENVLAWAREYNLINDKQFADIWVENRKLLKPMGKRRLAQELKQKGISGEIVTGCLADYTDNEQYQLARNLVEAKLIRTIKPLIAEKIFAWLLRRGFSISVSTNVVRELSENNQWVGKLLNS